MSDLTDRLRNRGTFMDEEAAAEIERLRAALRHQEDRDGHIGTHSDSCHTFGPRHYDCALREIESLNLSLITSAGETQAALDRVAELEERKDGAYLERNQVVAALAKCFPSGVAKTAIEGWSEDWHGCVYIDLPTGQASWHFHDSHAYLFAGLPAYVGAWDGHDTPEKYRRLAAIDTARGT